jgi:CheY-like chemotaxis protein
MKHGRFGSSSFARFWNDCDQCGLSYVTNSPTHALILVVDDDVLERMGASDMFLDAGYRVLEAEDADEALRIFETNADIGLLFTDVSMPGSMSGSDLARQVAERWPRVGIMVTSGRPRPDKLPLSMRFHDKPYDPIAVLRQAKEMTIPLG